MNEVELIKTLFSELLNSKLDERLSSIESRIDRLESKIDELRKDLLSNKNESRPEVLRRTPKEEEKYRKLEADFKKMMNKHLDEDPRDVWTKALFELSLQLRGSEFETWFGETRFESLDEETCTFTLSNPQPFARAWLEDHYTIIVSGVLNDLTGQWYKIRFVCLSGAGSTLIS